MKDAKFAIGVAYYVILILAIVTAMVCYYVCVKQGLMRVGAESPTALIIQYVMIAYVLLTLPLGFKFLSNSGEKRFWRIVMFGVGLIACIVAFYATTIMSMFWLAAIEAIALVISKPRKIRDEEC